MISSGITTSKSIWMFHGDFPLPVHLGPWRRSSNSVAEIHAGNSINIKYIWVNYNISLT